MSKIPFRTVESILLGLPKSSKNLDFSNEENSVFKIDNTIVVIPNNGIDLNHLMDILESQLGMSWWMIDYVLGQNGITS